MACASQSRACAPKNPHPPVTERAAANNEAHPSCKEDYDCAIRLDEGIAREIRQFLGLYDVVSFYLKKATPESQTASRRTIKSEPPPAISAQIGMAGRVENRRNPWRLTKQVVALPKCVFVQTTWHYQPQDGTGGGSPNAVKKALPDPRHSAVRFFLVLV